ncbi:hypothetical protein HPB50_028743 [Hyalomma asiaticum]|nr:hypothetical protein HPB50_028743 [Hyalomma asiaticum]
MSAAKQDQQDIVRTEIDSVMKDKEPGSRITWKDRTKMPYTQAFIRETMRCKPVNPLALMRCSRSSASSALSLQLFLEALVALARTPGVFSVGAAEGERGHTRLYPWLTHYMHGDQDSSVPARTSVSRSSRECYAVLSDGPESTESLHSDRLCAGTVSSSTSLERVACAGAE